MLRGADLTLTNARFGVKVTFTSGIRLARIQWNGTNEIEILLI